MKTLVITSGGFDPLHAGHISAFERMAKVGNLLVIYNNDQWIKRKNEKVFMTSEYRRATLLALKSVFDCMEQCSVTDNHVIKDLCDVLAMYKNEYDRFVFAKSGDRTHENSPEYAWCMANGVEWLEVQSDYPDLHSSKILSDWQNTKVERSWGHYLTTVPYQVDDIKFKPKVLVVKPGQSLSLQSHKHRQELWYVYKGYGKSGPYYKEVEIFPGDSILIEMGEKHQVRNAESRDDLVILEWQIGSVVDESDITRYTT